MLLAWMLLISMLVWTGIVLLLEGCTTIVPAQRPHRQEIMDTAAPMDAFGKVQRMFVHQHMRITQSAVEGLIIVAERPTGLKVIGEVAPLGIGTLITFTGQPAHDVQDMALAYKAER